MVDDEQVARLLALAVHELRTPANVIGGSLRVLRTAQRDEVAPRVDRAFQLAERNYDRLVEVLSEAGDLWRLMAGEATFNRQPADLGRVVEGASRLVSSRGFEAPDVQWRGGGPCRVLADPHRLEQSLAALMLLVRRQSPDTARLVLTVAVVDGADNPTVRLVIAPAGAEPPVDAPLAALDEWQPGLGLALPVARRVIEAERGSVGEATTGAPRPVVVSLPLCT